MCSSCYITMGLKLLPACSATGDSHPSLNYRTLHVNIVGNCQVIHPQDLPSTARTATRPRRPPGRWMLRLGVRSHVHTLRGLALNLHHRVATALPQSSTSGRCTGPRLSTMPRHGHGASRRAPPARSLRRGRTADRPSFLLVTVFDADVPSAWAIPQAGSSSGHLCWSDGEVALMESGVMQRSRELLQCARCSSVRTNATR